MVDILAGETCPTLIQDGYNVPVLYEDNHLIVVKKPHRLLVQGDNTGDITLVDIVKSYIKEKYQKPGNVFLGIVHRLDRPAAGIVILARTSKGAQRLSEQFREKTVKKTYTSWVAGKTPEKGKWEDWLVREGVTSGVVRNKDGKRAVLGFRRVWFENGQSLVEIDLETGRHHQIRVQFAYHGFPILGDMRYHSRVAFPNRSIALLCKSVSFVHPTQKTVMAFTVKPDDFWPVYSY